MDELAQQNALLKERLQEAHSTNRLREEHFDHAVDQLEFEKQIQALKDKATIRERDLQATIREKDIIIEDLSKRYQDFREARQQDADFRDRLAKELSREALALARELIKERQKTHERAMEVLQQAHVRELEEQHQGHQHELHRQHHSHLNEIKSLHKIHDLKLQLAVLEHGHREPPPPNLSLLCNHSTTVHPGTANERRSELVGFNQEQPSSVGNHNPTNTNRLGSPSFDLTRPKRPLNGNNSEQADKRLRIAPHIASDGFVVPALPVNTPSIPPARPQPSQTMPNDTGVVREDGQLLINFDTRMAEDEAQTSEPSKDVIAPESGRNAQQTKSSTSIDHLTKNTDHSGPPNFEHDRSSPCSSERPLAAGCSDTVDSGLNHSERRPIGNALRAVTCQKPAYTRESTQESIEVVPRPNTAVPVAAQVDEDTSTVSSDTSPDAESRSRRTYHRITIDSASPEPPRSSDSRLQVPPASHSEQSGSVVWIADDDLCTNDDTTIPGWDELVANWKNHVEYFASKQTDWASTTHPKHCVRHVVQRAGTSSMICTRKSPGKFVCRRCFNSQRPCVKYNPHTQRLELLPLPPQVLDDTSVVGLGRYIADQPSQSQNYANVWPQG